MLTCILMRDSLMCLSTSVTITSGLAFDQVAIALLSRVFKLKKLEFETA